MKKYNFNIRVPIVLENLYEQIMRYECDPQAVKDFIEYSKNRTDGFAFFKNRQDGGTNIRLSSARLVPFIKMHIANGCSFDKLQAMDDAINILGLECDIATVMLNDVGQLGNLVYTIDDYLKDVGSVLLKEFGVEYKNKIPTTTINSSEYKRVLLYILNTYSRYAGSNSALVLDI